MGPKEAKFTPAGAEGCGWMLGQGRRQANETGTEGGKTGRERFGWALPCALTREFVCYCIRNRELLYGFKQMNDKVADVFFLN